MTRRPIRHRKGLQQRHPLALFGLLRVMARSLEIANQMAAPNQPGPVMVVTGPGLRSNPNVHRASCGSLRVRIEAG